MIKAHETINLEKSPIEFIKYCTSIFKKEKVAYGLSRLDSKRTGLIMDFNNPKQIFDEAFAQNIQEVYISFLNVPQIYINVPYHNQKQKLNYIWLHNC